MEKVLLAIIVFGFFGGFIILGVGGLFLQFVYAIKASGKGHVDTNIESTTHYHSTFFKGASDYMSDAAYYESKADEARAMGNNVVARGWSQAAARSKAEAMKELMK